MSKLKRLKSKRLNREEGKKTARLKLSTDYLIESIGNSSRFFVFGLNWSVVLGEDLDKEAYNLARKNRADFYLRGGSRANTVGLLKTNKENGHPVRGTELYSIAATFARSLPNSAFVVRFLTPKGVWFMAANEGLVQEGTDKFYKSQEEVDALIAHYKKRFRSLIIYGDQPDDQAMPEIGDLLPYIGQSSQLKRASVSLRSIPKWAWIAFAIGVGYVGYEKGTKKWDSYQREKRLAEQELLYVDPVEGWTKALNEWSDKTKVLGFSGIDQWGTGIGEIPTHIGRWRLNELNCTEVGACTGVYFRMPLGSLESFERYVPEKWDYMPNGLDVMTASFTIPLQLMSLSELGFDSLPKKLSSEKEKINLFQSILPIIKSVDMSESVKVPVNEPKQEQAGGGFTLVPFPSDSDLIHPYVSKFEVKMPLRGLLAINWASSYAIKGVDIKRVDGEMGSKDGLLELTIQGEHYVQE